jgi:gp16 family phage-associated protein
MKSQATYPLQEVGIPSKILTLQEAREEFVRKGKTIREWAHEHGFDEATVAQVLRGYNKGTRGVGHKIAVKLGIKDGEIVD